MMNFWQDESGAITVDWVVLTAGLVGLGIATTAVVSGGMQTQSTAVSGTMTGIEISASFDTGTSLADWLAGYTPVNMGLHGPSWGPDAEGRNWVENTYDSWSALSDAEITAMYTADYASAVGGDATRADYIAVQQMIMAERGIDIPSGNLTADEVAALF